MMWIIKRHSKAEERRVVYACDIFLNGGSLSSGGCFNWKHIPWGVFSFFFASKKDDKEIFMDHKVHHKGDICLHEERLWRIYSSWFFSFSIKQGSATVFDIRLSSMQASTLWWGENIRFHHELYVFKNYNEKTPSTKERQQKIKLLTRNSTWIMARSLHVFVYELKRKALHSIVKVFIHFSILFSKKKRKTHLTNFIRLWLKNGKTLSIFVIY